MASYSAPTMQELLTDVRTLLGQSDPNNSTWTDVELRRYINEAITRYWGEVIQGSEGLFTTSTTLDTVANTETVALPSTFFEVVRLWAKDGNDWVPLDYDNGFNLPDTDNGSSTGSGWVPRYRLRGNNLVLTPKPSNTATAVLKIDYISWPDKLSLLSDTMTTAVAPVFQPLIAAYAAWKAKVVESSRGHGVNTYAPFQVLVSDLYNQFRDIISQRSHAMDYVRPFNPEVD